MVITDIENKKAVIDRNVWRPHAKQARFLSIPFDIKEALYGGGAGSAKTDVLVMFALVHKFHEHPRFKQVLLRRTHAELKNEVVSRTQDIYPKFGARFNKSDMQWTFPRPDQFGSGAHPNGAIIKLGHCENESDVKQYDSMEISLFSPDEITSLTEYIYLYIAFERNRAPKGSGLPSITRGAGMPGGVGHKFTKMRFVDPYKEGGRKIIGRGGNARIYIHATLSDNPHIDPTYKQSLEGRPEAEKRAKLYGDWDAYAGQVFDEFRDRKYPDEPDNAIHVVEPFDIPTWWPKFVVGDWGYAALCYMGFFAVSPSKRLYQYRELAWLKTKIADWGPILRSYIAKDQPKFVKFCQSIAQERGQQQTIQQQIEDELGYPIELTTNKAGSRIARKMNLHEYLRWRQKPSVPEDEVRVYDEHYAAWIMRNFGMNKYKEYLATFNPTEEETNLPKLQIFRCISEGSHDHHPNCCPLAIESIKACSYDKPKNDKPAEDVKEFDGDDPYDVVSYGCDAAEQYFEQAASEFERIRKQEEIIKRLHSDSDFTAFYRNMHKIESGERQLVGGVQRYRR